MSLVGCDAAIFFADDARASVRYLDVQFLFRTHFLASFFEVFFHAHLAAPWLAEIQSL